MSREVLLISFFESSQKSSLRETQWLAVTSALVLVSGSRCTDLMGGVEIQISSLT